MAKSTSPKKTTTQPATAPTSLPTTTSAIITDPNTGYKLRVLHGFRNIAKDQAAQKRISTTTDPLYISGPYFTPDEAASVKGAVVDTWKAPAAHDAEPEEEECDFEIIPSEAEAARSVQDTLEGCMERFFEKRRASGDARPCGPHDLAPLYEAVFGVGRAELGEEGFLRRLRKSGLPACGDGEGSAGGGPEKGKDKKRKGK